MLLIYYLYKGLRHHYLLSKNKEKKKKKEISANDNGELLVEIGINVLKKPLPSQQDKV